MSSNIRRQSIVSSITIYIGFIIGAINTYFFAKEGLFTPEEYGLIQLLTPLAGLIATLSVFAMPAYILKFFPYYNSHLKPEKNEMLTIALLVGIAGFLVLFVLGFFFEDIVVRKYSENSPLFINYYYWLYVLGFGLTVYNILEAYCQSLRMPVFASFLRELEWRLITTVLIVLFIAGIIPDFATFIKFYSFTYLAIALTLFIYLIQSKKFFLVFKISKLSLRLRPVILKFVGFMFGAGIIFTLSQAFDSMVIAAVVPNGLAALAIFTLAQFMSSVIQVPQRSIVGVTVPHIAQAWKDKDVPKINMIYVRSSINLLIVSLFLFLIIALNYTDAIRFFNLNKEYLLGFNAFLFLGLTRVVELGTGVNAQIIGTSRYWRFEIWSGVILLVLVLPLSYFFAKSYGIIGPPIAALISTFVYNGVRIWFLWDKFKLFPFTLKTFYTLLVGAGTFGLTYLLFKNHSGFWALAGRSIVFTGTFVGSIWLLKITPDLSPVLQSFIKRIKR